MSFQFQQQGPPGLANTTEKTVTEAAEARSFRIFRSQNLMPSTVAGLDHALEASGSKSGDVRVCSGTKFQLLSSLVVSF